MGIDYQGAVVFREDDTDVLVSIGFAHGEIVRLPPEPSLHVYYPEDQSGMLQGEYVISYAPFTLSHLLKRTLADEYTCPFFITDADGNITGVKTFVTSNFNAARAVVREIAAMSNPSDEWVSGDSTAHVFRRAKDGTWYKIAIKGGLVEVTDPYDGSSNPDESSASFEIVS